MISGIPSTKGMDHECSLLLLRATNAAWRTWYQTYLWAKKYELEAYCPEHAEAVNCEELAVSELENLYQK